jgi:hypothetical protein
LPLDRPLLVPAPDGNPIFPASEEMNEEVFEDKPCPGHAV